MRPARRRSGGSHDASNGAALLAPASRQRIGGLLFLLLVGIGLAARDSITDAQWIALLWLSAAPLLLALWPDLSPRMPQINRATLRMAAIFLTIMALCAVQLLRVQVVMSDSFSQRVAADPATGDIVSNPLLADAALRTPRGAILDRNGVVLAESVLVNGVQQRRYPTPDTVDVTGYFSPLLYGRTGLEASWDDELMGLAGGNLLWQVEQDLRGAPPVGNDLHLTLDAALQQQAHALLGSRPGAVVLLDAQTGAVLALASSPTFDANALTALTDEQRAAAQASWATLTGDPRNPLVSRATSGLYAPGSTFKTVTAAAAIQRGIANADSVYEDTGSITIDSHTLVEANRPDDSVTDWTLRDAFSWSLNVVFAQIGLQLGGPALADAARNWGWDSVIPFDIPSEPSRVFVTPGFLDNDLAVAETAFGQGELLVTPLQMALVAAGIANEGEVMRPYLVQSITGPDGETLRETAPQGWRRGVDRAAAQQTAALMQNAVELGALGGAYVPGYAIGGKTGTAETAGEQPHAWFIGFIGAPGQPPQYAVAVILESAGGGGQVALPIGRDLLVAAMGG
ncbi:MAG: penicillin-binding transpeptidase domain-containing protein [Thermomicrobiales bacterium]